MVKRSRYFSEKELACKCGECDSEMDDYFIAKLENLRVRYGKAMPVTSGFRCKAHNAAVGGAEDSAHVTGEAVDVQIAGVDAYHLVSLAMRAGFTGIGVSQSSKQGWHSRFIHLDTKEGEKRPRIWSY